MQVICCNLQPGRQIALQNIRNFSSVRIAFSQQIVYSPNKPLADVYFATWLALYQVKYLGRRESLATETLVAIPRYCKGLFLCQGQTLVDARQLLCNPKALFQGGFWMEG